jgi:sideroflexin-1/3
MTAVAGEGQHKRISIDEPRYDQSTYSGRAKHFFITTNPLNVFASSSQLDKARELVVQYR